MAQFAQNSQNTAAKQRHWSSSAAFRLGGSTLITAALLIAIVRTQSLDSFLSLAAGVYLPGVGLYFLINVAALFARALRYRWILSDALGEENIPSLPGMLVVTAIRNALVDFLPARLGELSYFYVLKRYGVSAASALSCFGLCLALDVAVLGVLLVPILLGGAFQSEEQSSLAALFAEGAAQSLPLYALCVGAAVLLLYAIILNLDVFARLAARSTQTLLRVSGWETILSPAARFFSRIESELKQIRASGRYLRLTAITVFLRAAKYGSLYVLLLSVVHPLGAAPADISPLISTCAFLAAEASASLPISGLMGFGAYEGAASLIFSVSKVEIPSVPSVILLVHLITQVGGYSIALLALAVFLRKELSK